MPFPKWTVDPVYLSRRAIPPDKEIEDELECNALLTLAATLRQLADLTRIVDVVFEELGAECRRLVERSENVAKRAQGLAEVVDKLDAKKVQVPLADLTWFSQQKSHFQSPQLIEFNLFNRESRPECIRRLYTKAAVKGDGQEVCEVIWGDEQRKKLREDLLEIETRRPAILTPAHQRSRSAPARPEGNDEVEGATTIIDDEPPLILLPTPEEQLQELTKEFPPAIISIDTSGKSFSRMASMRKSLIHVDFFIRTKNRKNKKVKRSNTVCDSCSQGGTLRRETVSAGNLKLSHTSVQTDSANNNNNINNSQIKERTKRRSDRLSAGSMSGTVESSGSSQDIPTTLKNEKRISFYEKLKQMGRRRDSSKERREEKETAVAKLPISSNSQAINVAVKLRESSSRPSEQGQSSSGNWSGTSSGASTRASDCDRDVSPQTVQDVSSHDRSGSTVKKSTSETSLEKDSALSDVTQTTDRMPKRMLSPPRVKALKSTHRPPHLRKISTCSDDGESSTYSIDTDGYYTSMHTDSGIPHQIPEELIEEPEPSPASEANLVRRASQGSIDTASVNSILSACDAQTILDDDDLHDLKTLTLTRVRMQKEVLAQSTPTKSKPKPAPPPRTSSVPLTALDNQQRGSLNNTVDTVDNEGFIVKTTINKYRYPSICVVSSSETSESSDETTKSPLTDKEHSDPSQVSSLSPISHLEEHRVFQIKNAFQPVVMHPTRLRSFSIDENANEKRYDEESCGVDFTSLPPDLHIGRAQILHLDTEVAQQHEMNNANKTYQRLYRPSTLLARNYTDKEWMTDGSMSLPLDLASNGVPLRRRMSPCVVSPTRGILSRNSEILSQSSPETETKSLSESPVDNSPLGIPPPPPLSYHSSILDEGSMREPSVAQSPAKSLEDNSVQPKYSTLSLGRSSRLPEILRSSSSTIPRSFKLADVMEDLSPTKSAHMSTFPRMMVRSETEPTGAYAVPSIPEMERYPRCNSVEICVARPPSSGSERSVGEGRGTPMNHFSPIGTPHTPQTAPGILHPIALSPIQTVHNPRSRSGIVDLDLNLEACYVPPPQPELPVAPNRPSRPSSLYDDSKVYATFLPGPHTPVATYVPTKQYQPVPSGVTSGYATPYEHTSRGYSPNQNSLPSRVSEHQSRKSPQYNYSSPSSYQTPGALQYERPVVYGSKLPPLEYCVSDVVTANTNGPAKSMTRNLLGSTDVSPRSSRSASPSSRPETNYPRDRRSWSVQSDNPPVYQNDVRRASLASDRLGPCKPTSLTDFKRLLIHTRSQTNPAGERKSATELLKLAKQNPPPNSGSTASGGTGTSSSGSKRQPGAMKFNAAIEPIQEEGESGNNSPAKPSLV